MNITHAIEETIIGDKMQAIFNRQKELMEKYHDIEIKSGLLQTEDCPVNLDDKRGQARIKDFAWRMTEEIGEALDSMEDNSHFIEELIDGLHFLTELSILSGATPEMIVEKISIPSNEKPGDCLDLILNHALNIRPLDDYISWQIEDVIRELGMMCNCLKNKPWKQSQMKTDKEAFYTRLSNTWVAYIGYLGSWLKSDEITQIYLKKSQVNKFRQRSNY